MHTVYRFAIHNRVYHRQPGLSHGCVYGFFFFHRILSRYKIKYNGRYKNKKQHSRFSQSLFFHHRKINPYRLFGSERGCAPNRYPYFI